MKATLSATLQDLIQTIQQDPVLKEWQTVLQLITPERICRLFTHAYTEPQLKQFSQTLFDQHLFFNNLLHFIQLLQSQLNSDDDHAQLKANLNLLAKHCFHLQLEADLKQLTDTQLSSVFLSAKEQELIAQHQNWLKQLMELAIQQLITGQPQEASTWTQHLAIGLKNCPLTHTLDRLNHQNIEIINPIPPIQDLHQQLHLQTEQLYFILQQRKPDYQLAFQLYQELKVTANALESQIKAKLLSQVLFNVYIDPLTGVYSRIKLAEDLKRLRPKKFALLNIEKFGQFNAAFGLESGDNILKYLAQTLKKRPEVEKVYHLYADVFAIILHSHLSIDYDTFLKQTETEFNLGPDHTDYLLELSLSYCEDCERPLSTCEYGLMGVKEKRIRLIDAKQLSDQMKKRLSHTADWVQKIKLALADNRLVTVYQPILNLHTQHIEKYECLMRLEDTHGQLASPSEFLPILEKMFLYHEASHQMLWQAFQTFSTRAESFSVNLSLKDIKNPHLLPTLKSLAETYPNTAQRCVLELLENEAFEQAPEVESFITKVRTLGFQIAIDDFGSGFSNFAYLFQMPLDFIKLDGSLIQNIADPKIATLCQHVIEMAHNMHIQVIAEFVSTDALRTQVSQLGADYAQGYAIGKPERTPLLPQGFY